MKNVFPHAVGLEVVVEHADDGVGSFTCVDSLINQVIHLKEDSLVEIREQ